MKKSDLAMIALIASISVLAAFFATRAIFGEQANEPVTVKTVNAISSDVIDPDPAIFNENAINPAVEVQIDSGEE